MPFLDFKLNRNLYLGAILSASIVVVLLWIFPITNYFELKITDIKFSLRSKLDKEPEISSDIVMINIDDYSKNQSEFDLWPYSYYAETIEKINDGEPNSLGIDIFFTLSVDTVGWYRLLNAVENSFVSINPYLIEFGEKEDMLDLKQHSDILKNLKYENLPLIKQNQARHVKDIRYKTKLKFMNVSAGLGHVTIENDEDGILRRLPLIAEIDGMLAPHFYLRVLSEHLDYDLENIEVIDKSKLIFHNFPMGGIDRDLYIPLDGNGNILINYISYKNIVKSEQSKKFQSKSAWEIIQLKGPPDLKNKLVILGDTSVPARDHSMTPIDKKLFNPLIYAIAISNILNDEFITPIKGLTSLIIIILILVLFILLAINLDLLKFGISSFIILIIYSIFNILLFIYFGLLIPFVEVMLPLFVSLSYLLIYCTYKSQVKMGVLEGSLQSYLSPHLMDKIKRDPDMLKLGGKRKRISVVFSDIVGFTSFTDKADPEEVQIVLEEYFSEMTSIVFKHNGIVDKYMGDGILAFFENPKDGVISAQAAVKSAIEMKKKAALLDQKYKKQKRFPFSIYVGIATGYAKVGNIGPPEKVDYTIIGSVVNRASRLDGIGSSGDILMDEDTYFFVRDDYNIDDVGSLKLKGFENHIPVYRLK